MVTCRTALVDERRVQSGDGRPDDHRPDKAGAPCSEAATIELVLEPARIVVVVSSYFRAQARADGAFYGESEDFLRTRFNAYTPARGKLVAGAARIDQYGAARRVVTEKGGLRTAQDFHILDIVHVQCGSDRLPEVNAIDKHADGWLDRWNSRVDAKPANCEGRIARDRA